MINKENKKVWLVIEKNVYGDSHTFTVAKSSTSLQEAMRFKLCLEDLNDRDKQSYFLASDSDTIMNTVVSSHNKSVENGSYYEKHPEVKKPVETKASGNEVNITEEIVF